MNYVRLGRGVGIGARLAGKALSKALEPGPTAPAAAAPVSAPAEGRAHPQRGSFQQRSKAVAHGTRKFGKAVWGPFAHAGRTLWLEVAGVFFGIFALFFAQQTWSRRSDYAHGPEHQHFVAFGIVCAMFLYLAASSFARSMRKGPSA